MVELDGFLTFDKGSYYKITPELNPFQQAYYDPKAFAIVSCADPGKIVGITPLWNNGTNPGVRVDYSIPDLGGSGHPFAPLVKPATEAELLAQISRSFVLDADYKGDNGYSGWGPYYSNN